MKSDICDIYNVTVSQMHAAILSFVLICESL